MQAEICYTNWLPATGDSTMPFRMVRRHQRGTESGQVLVRPQQNSQCFPWSLSLLLKHVSQNLAHTVVSIRGPLCSFSPQILLVGTTLFKLVRKSTNLLLAIGLRKALAPLMSVGFCVPPLCSICHFISYYYHHSSSCLISPKRLSTPDLCMRVSPGIL